MADRFHPADLLGKRVYWLLDFKYAGMTIRLSDAELDVLTDAGESLHYHGNIQTLNVDEGLDFLSDASAAPTSASIDVVLPVDVPLLIARGHDLGGATATLSRWIEGTTHEAARPVISGGVRDPSHGSVDEPISFTLELTPWSDSRVIPSPALTVTGANLEDDWVLSLPAESLGLAYPIVIGKPGVVSTAINSSGKITGSQLVPLHFDTTAYTSPVVAGNCIWLLAGHHVAAKRVYINSDTYTTAVRVKVYNGRDRLGHPIAFVPWWGLADDDADVPAYPYDWSGTPVTYSTTVTDTDSASTYTTASAVGPSAGSDVIDDGLRNTTGPAIYGIWRDDIDGGGGLIGSDGLTMRGAGDVILWLLGQSSTPVDRGRFAAMKPILNAYKLDFTIDAEVTPWEFLRANILPLLPLSLVSGPGGIYPVVWRYDATARDAVGRLDLSSDPYIERASSVTYDRDSIVNDLSLKYALSVRTGEYQGLARLSADASDGATPSLYCNLSQRRYRRPDGSALVVQETMEAPCVYETATALAILGWMSRAKCFAKRRVEYLAPEAVYGWLERGNIVTLTDPSLRYSDTVAIIEAIGTDGSAMLRLKLLLIEAPERDGRLV